MKVRINGRKQLDRIDAITSKSFVHRMLIAAALSDTETVIRTNVFSQDMRATAECLIALGAEIEETEDSFVVKEGVTHVGKAVLNCYESGSTARFMMPLGAIYADYATFEGSGKLPERPQSALTDVLREHGCNILDDYLPLTITGELKSGKFEIRGDVSSQYITGLLIALPLLDGDSEIVLTTPLSSKGYIDITLSVLRTFKIDVEETGRGYRICGGQKYVSPRVIEAEADWSNGAALLVMNEVSEPVNVCGLNMNSVQGDRAIVDIIESYRKSDIGVRSFDIKNIPDIAPYIAVLGFMSKSETLLLNTARLRIKESDRAEAIVSVLKAFGCFAEIVDSLEEENIVIGTSNKAQIEEGTVITVDGMGDHRIVMMEAMMSLASNVPVIINGAEAVNKSYPGFFELFDTEVLEG